MPFEDYQMSSDFLFIALCKLSVINSMHQEVEPHLEERSAVEAEAIRGRLCDQVLSLHIVYSEFGFERDIREYLCNRAGCTTVLKKQVAIRSFSSTDK